MNLKLSDYKNHHFFALTKYLTLIILLISFKLEGQYHFSFEIDSSEVEDCWLEGEWKQVPGQRWCCDTVLPIVGKSSMHHSYDNSQEGCDYLVFRHDPLNIQDSFVFSFRIRHGFLPSSQNNWQLALGATLDDGSGPEGGEAQILRAIVLGVNYSGSDDLVKIWLVDQGVSQVLCSTTLNYQEVIGSSQAPLFRLQGDGGGNLDLYWSRDPVEELPEHLASCRIDGISWGRQLLVRYKYTSSRDQALWLDELRLEGQFEKDTIAPEVSDVKFLSASILQLELSEQVVFSDACTFILYLEDFSEGLSPEDIRYMGEGFQITFPEKIPNRVPCRLLVAGVEDEDGNLMADTIVNVLRNETQWGDVVFNEIMADPDPVIRFEEEYLELFNRSGYPVDLIGWNLQVNERSYFLDTTHVAGDMGGYISLVGISVPNEGATLSLYSDEGRLIHACSYRIPWNGPDWKKEGGWSLESPDADLICRISANWEYSGDPGGGTPGRINSNQMILVDDEPPVLLYAGLGDPGELILHYNEPLQIIQDMGEAILLDPGAVLPDTVRLEDPLWETLHLHFPDEFIYGSLFRISLPGLRDCAGNRSGKQEFTAGTPFLPTPASVLINEIMYDPEEGRPEYVELFLPGNRILDLRDLAIHLVEPGGSPDHPVPLSSHSRLVRPGQYLVLTKCVPHLLEAYGLEESGQWVEVAGLPGLKNSSGCIFLTDRAGQVVDMAVYSDEMHMELLDDPRGISLERISAERSGNDPDNWHSAASIAAYATPGRVNSQSYAESETEQILEIQPEVFSPDNDGYEDLLKITIHTGGNDWVIGLLITDLHGNRIRILANNHLAAPSVSYTWDGEGEDGSMESMGFYVIHVRGYNPRTGKQWIKRKAVGLVYR